ncbi:hypothetical protein ARMGADRAFT_1008759 [Armillaria gallica]|uniref:Uncharacterized protein n=1 Tax=Armillaria gallica TaxID=47427 RepID=A0A2H3E5A5_ARMGA|nr:hypothetical protein ARMGADRAFT_1008759 [Armillaria gallica]
MRGACPTLRMTRRTNCAEGSRRPKGSRHLFVQLKDDHLIFKKDPALAILSTLPWTGIFFLNLRLSKLNVVDGSYNVKNVNSYKLEVTAPSPLCKSSPSFCCDVSLPFVFIRLLVFQLV